MVFDIYPVRDIFIEGIDESIYSSLEWAVKPPHLYQAFDQSLTVTNSLRSIFKVLLY